MCTKSRQPLLPINFADSQLQLALLSKGFVIRQTYEYLMMKLINGSGIVHHITYAMTHNNR